MKKYLFAAAVFVGTLAMAQDSQFYKDPQDTRNDATFQADCKAGIALSSCFASAIAPDCSPDKHWTKAGSNIPHCVLNDMDCSSGTKLDHDKMGNPECAPIVCQEGELLTNGVCERLLPPVFPLPVPAFNGQAYGGHPYLERAVSGINVSSHPKFPKMHLILNTSDGTWSYAATSPINPNGCCAAITAPSSGTWTTTPATSYEYRITGMEYGPYSSPFTAGAPYQPSDGKDLWTGIITNPSTPMSWTALPANSRVSVAGIDMDVINGCSYSTGTRFTLDIRFTLQLRPTLSPASVTEAKFDLVFHPTTTNISCTPYGA